MLTLCCFVQTFSRYSTMLAENLVDVRLQNQENDSLQTNQRSQQELAQENINASSPTDVGV